jgi:hypothetical protein
MSGSMRQPLLRIAAMKASARTRSRKGTPRARSRPRNTNPFA